MTDTITQASPIFGVSVANGSLAALIWTRANFEVSRGFDLRSGAGYSSYGKLDSDRLRNLLPSAEPHSLPLKKASQKGVPVPAHHADTKAVLAPLVPVPVPIPVTVFCRGCREGRGRAGASGHAWQQGGWLPSSAPLFMEGPGRLGSVLVFRQNKILIFS